MLTKEEGFTIIEIVVVVAILTVSILSIVGIFAYNNQTNEKNEDIAQALSFSEKITEDVKAICRDMVNNQNLIDVSTEFTPDNILGQLNNYYVTASNNIKSSLDSDDDGDNSNNKFEILADDLNISVNNALFIKRNKLDNMMAIVEINNYKQRDDNGNIVRDSDGADIIIPELKHIKVKVKWLDREGNIRAKNMETLVTRR